MIFIKKSMVTTIIEKYILYLDNFTQPVQHLNGSRVSGHVAKVLTIARI